MFLRRIFCTLFLLLHFSPQSSAVEDFSEPKHRGDAMLKGAVKCTEEELGRFGKTLLSVTTYEYSADGKEATAVITNDILKEKKTIHYKKIGEMFEPLKSEGVSEGILAGNTWAEWTYDDKGRLTEVHYSNQWKGKEEIRHSYYRYAYDEKGRRIKESYSGDGKKWAERNRSVYSEKDGWAMEDRYFSIGQNPKDDVISETIQTKSDPNKFTAERKYVSYSQKEKTFFKDSSMKFNGQGCLMKCETIENLTKEDGLRKPHKKIISHIYFYDQWLRPEVRQIITDLWKDPKKIDERETTTLIYKYEYPDTKPKSGVDTGAPLQNKVQWEKHYSVDKGVKTETGAVTYKWLLDKTADRAFVSQDKSWTENSTFDLYWGQMLVSKNKKEILDASGKAVYALNEFFHRDPWGDLLTYHRVVASAKPDPMAGKFRYKYDDKHRITEKQVEKKVGAKEPRKVEYENGKDGGLLEKHFADKEGKVLEYVLIRKVDAENRILSEAEEFYDVAGKLFRKRQSRFEYAKTGELKKVIFTETFENKEERKLMHVKEESETLMEYDAQNRRCKESKAAVYTYAGGGTGKKETLVEYGYELR